MNKKIILKIIAGTTAILIIGMIFSVFNAFMGNPISSAIATSKIKVYVKETYPTLELNVPKAKYNFKDSDYYSLVQSKTSEDTCFSISYSRGRINDSYEYEVKNHFTTYRRLSSEFSKEVEKIITDDFPYKTDILFADLGKGDDELENLTLDMILDITNPPISSSLTIYILDQDVSYEFLSARLMELYNIMNKHKIRMDYYTVVIQEPSPEGEKAAMSGESNHLIDFPVEKIKSEDLIETIKEHQKEYEESNKK